MENVTAGRIIIILILLLNMNILLLLLLFIFTKISFGETIIAIVFADANPDDVKLEMDDSPKTPGVSI